MSLAFLPAPGPLVAFVVAALAVILAPGPDTVFALAQGAGGSRNAGLRAALGVAVVCLGVAVALH